MQEIKELITLLEIDINEAEQRGYLPANLAMLKLMIALHERMGKLEEIVPAPHIIHQESAHTGIMIAFMLDADTAKKIAIPGGEAPDDLHITLAYLGDVDEFGDTEELKATIDRFVISESPMTVKGNIGGIGRFTPSDSSDNLSPVVALVNLPGLQEWRRRLVVALDSKGRIVSSDFDFLPHITLAYLAPDSPSPVHTTQALPLAFDTLWLCIGDERIPYKLGKQEETYYYKVEALDRDGRILGKQWEEEPHLYGSLMQESSAPRVFKSALKDIVTREILQYGEHKSFSGHLENGIAQCYFEAQRYAYNKAMQTVGIASDGTSEGIINTVKGFVGKFKPLLPAALAWAKEQVASIVSTMREMFDNFISGLGDIDPAEIATQIQEWLTNLASWKSEQIANVAWQSGLDVGTNAAITDILDAATDPEMLPGLAIDNMRVRVLPEESSSDHCKEYAGQDYSLEDYTALGITWPFHPECPHFCEIYMDIGDEM